MTKTITVKYTAKFLRLFKKLDRLLQDRVAERIQLFRDESNHKNLKVHKLKGVLCDSYSFSVTQKHRIVFEYGESKQEVILLVVGDHDVYQ